MSGHGIHGAVDHGALGSVKFKMPEDAPTAGTTASEALDQAFQVRIHTLFAHCYALRTRYILHMYPAQMHALLSLVPPSSVWLLILSPPCDHVN